MTRSLMVTCGGRVATKMTASAISSGFSMAARRSALGRTGLFSIRGVSTSPGQMTQARTPCFPCSALSLLLKDRGHTQHVVAPRTNSALRQVIEIEFKVPLEFFRPNHQLPVGARCNRNLREESDGRRHHIAVVVVRMFSDEIHPAGRAKDSGHAAIDVFEATC